jgi:ubiquinone/menaquinone biosynthesis C-methylase UbiE
MTARATFETWADTYDLSVLQSLLVEPVHQAVLDLLHQHAPPGMRVLDIGCGTGRLLGLVHDRSSVAVGVDASARMLAAAKRLRDGPLLVRGLAEQLPFASGAFDVVTATLSLRHWQDPVRGIGEVARVLCPAGVLIVADADMEGKALRPRKRWHPRRPPGRQLVALLGQCGLEVVDFRPVPVHGPVPCVHVLAAHRRSRIPG